jgi:hypothetical protein
MSIRGTAAFAGGRRPSRSRRFRRGAIGQNKLMATIKLDFSNLPGDVALVLSQQQHTKDLADDLARVMRLDQDERELIHQEIVGAVAKVVDDYLAHRRPATKE